jgi:hypothetical protein
MVAAAKPVGGAESHDFDLGITSMTQRLAIAILLISVSTLSTRPAFAEITSVSASAPGGTVSSLAIESTFMTDDSVQFDADYKSPAPIVLTLTVDGSGNYFIGAPNGTVTNSTTASFPSFFAFLEGAPAGVIFVEASWDGEVFNNGTSFIPAFPTEVSFNFLERRLLYSKFGDGAADLRGPFDADGGPGAVHLGDDSRRPRGASLRGLLAVAKRDSGLTCPTDGRSTPAL